MDQLFFATIPVSASGSRHSFGLQDLASEVG